MLFWKLSEGEDKIIDSTNTSRESRLKRQKHYLSGFSNMLSKTYNSIFLALKNLFEPLNFKHGFKP